MKQLKLEDQIYLCKYHDVDKYLNTTLKLKPEEVEEQLKYLKSRGLYVQYRNISDEEYQNLIKRPIIKKVEHKQDLEEKNCLLDLNNLLFEELNILMDNSLTESELNEEIKKSKQIVAVSQTIINNADLLLRAKKHYDKLENKTDKIAPLLRIQ